ncbi:cell growth-regulating nucleolar protein [Apis dorsata]|uniref:cell growth-regulating nucleolar protein n=1 Tax=Apis dorsata TaxID=7462 RepID=UPI001293DF5F|nr:cell growth-regulating nucleolar protein [Apis dorsata]
MVVFTCNNCGETLQKPKVAKHYEFRCHTAPFLTCVDCLKDFRGDQYVAHTKCISEAERYGGKDYVPKAGANKGERKQQKWIDTVNNILNNETNLSKTERNFLNLLSKHENIPRKKVKFLNFVKSALGQKIPSVVVDSVWNKIETAYKNNVQDINSEKQQQENGKMSEKINNVQDTSIYQENNIIENQNNENIDRENQNEDQNKNNLNNSENGIDNDTINNAKKKKLKKRRMSETIQEQEEFVKKKSKQDVEFTKESVSKKKSKDIAVEKLDEIKKNKNTLLFESSINQCDNIIKKTFNWKNVILDIVKNKGEISLKKLQKKVISQYMNSCSNIISYEKACSKFNKKLKKISEIIISDEKVTLI